MPRVNLPPLPVSGLFALVKPSGPTSMSVINDLKKLVARSKLFVAADKLEDVKHRMGKRSRDPVKIGQGGTLDPLADGVLVIGVGKGTKRLSEFLDCTKEYWTTCLLGCETDTYDSEGASVRLAPWQHVTKETVENMLDRFKGEIEQAPPIFSALKMGGRPLYEYARMGIPLPRPIEKRKVTVHSIELVEWKGSNHTFRWPERRFSAEEKQAMVKALESVEDSVSLQDSPEFPDSGNVPSAFVLKMVVSGGTYVRSIVHDLAHVLDSAGHVVTLCRSRQGRFSLESNEGEPGCVPWEVFREALKDPGEVDEDGWTCWERKVMENLEIIEH